MHCPDFLLLLILYLSEARQYKNAPDSCQTDILKVIDSCFDKSVYVHDLINLNKHNVFAFSTIVAV